MLSRLPIVHFLERQDRRDSDGTGLWVYMADGNPVLGHASMGLSSETPYSTCC